MHVLAPELPQLSIRIAEENDSCSNEPFAVSQKLNFLHAWLNLLLEHTALTESIRYAGGRESWKKSAKIP